MATAYTTWNSSMEIGNTLIDSQHKQLISAINNLFDAYQSGNGRKEVEHTMNFLLDYTIKHFNEEEELQKEYNYPDCIQHKNIHSNFIEEVKKMATTLQLTGPSDDLISHICQTTGRWIINHIKQEDIKIANHIKSLQ